jgi:crotonobetainyl-CoA:carnitine CoA-transferase CaiB-like acyl-CoA transferase
MGADVIKIEKPGRGETVRWRADNDPEYGKRGMSLGFLTQSSNKRFITLDLDTPEGREIYLKLAAGCDVIVQNLRTGSAEKRGVGYEDVKKVNPKVIFCSITAFGNTGPKADHPAYDAVVQAWSGFMSTTGTSDTGPLKAGPPIIDYGTGMCAAFAVAAALYQRDRTGEGQYIDLSMIDATITLMASTVTEYLNTGVPPKPSGNNAASRAPASTTFNTAEGLLAIACNEEHQFRRMMDTLGLAALLEDDRYREPAARRDNVQSLRAAIQNALMQKSAADWESLLAPNGVPAGRVRTVPETMAETQIASRELFHRFTAADAGLPRDLNVPLAPFRYAHDGPRADTPPRTIGADTDAVLRELGYDDAALARLRASGAV